MSRLVTSTSSSLISLLGALSGVSLAMACSAGGGDGSNLPGSGGTSSGGTTAGGTSAGGTGNVIGVGGMGGTGNTGVGGFGGVGGGGNAGGSGGACETLNAEADAAVDILFVVDNSCSMEDEIQKIQTELNGSFVSIIEQSNLAYNLTFISARTGGPPLPGFPIPAVTDYPICINAPTAGPNCSDLPPRFSHIHCGVGSLNSLDVIFHAFDGTPIGGLETVACEPNKFWKDRLRFRSTKVITVITDDEYAGDQNIWDQWLTDTAQPSPAPGMFGTQQNRKYIFNGIIGMDKNNTNQACTSANNSAVAPGLKYQDLATKTGGQVASICEENWDGIFQSIANTLVQKLSCEYPIPEPPPGETFDPNKINVSYTPSGGTEMDLKQNNTPNCDGGGWRYDATMTKVELCGETCDAIKADPEGKLEIKFGCATEVVVPK